MPYRPNTALTRHEGSILPVYTPVGSSVLPRYVPIGTTDIEPREAENKAAIQAGILFFVGLALGYVWGGTTRGTWR